MRAGRYHPVTTQPERMAGASGRAEGPSGRRASGKGVNTQRARGTQILSAADPLATAMIPGAAGRTHSSHRTIAGVRMLYGNPPGDAGHAGRTTTFGRQAGIGFTADAPRRRGGH